MMKSLATQAILDGENILKLTNFLMETCHKLYCTIGGVQKPSWLRSSDAL